MKSRERKDRQKDTRVMIMVDDHERRMRSYPQTVPEPPQGIITC